jgi:exonuclease III
MISKNYKKIQICLTKITTIGIKLNHHLTKMIILFIGILFLISPLAIYPVSLHPEEVIEVKFMSYNINTGGQDGEKSGRKEEWLAVMKEESADVICIQEAEEWHSSQKNYLNKYQGDLNDYFGEDLSYSWAYVTDGGAEGYADQAILSRYPITNHTWYRSAQTEYNGTIYFDYAIQYVSIEIVDEIVHIFNFRLKSGPIFALERHLEMIGILSLIDNLPSGESVLVIGDINCYSPVDVADPNLEPNYSAGAYTLLQAGVGPVTELLKKNYTDTYRTNHPNEKGYTVVAEKWGIGLQPFCRIDYIFISPEKADDLISSDLIDSYMADYGSDHYPVVATLTFGSPDTTTTTNTSVPTSSPTSKISDSPTAGFELNLLIIIEMIAIVIYQRNRSNRK